MEDDVDSSTISTASIQFSVASSMTTGRDSDICTLSPSSNKKKSIRDFGGDVHHPMPTLRVPKPLGDRSSAGSAPLPVTSASSARAPQFTTSFQAIRPPVVSNNANCPGSPPSKEASRSFMQAVRRLDSDDQRLFQNRSTDSGGDNDDSASADRRRENAAEGDAIHQGNPTPPSRQLLIPLTSRLPQQCTRASDMTATTTNSSIHFEMVSSCEYDEKDKTAAEKADATPPTQQHQPPPAAVSPVKAPPAGTALPLWRPPEKQIPKKRLMKVATGAAGGSRGPRQPTAHQGPPSTTAGETSTLGTAGGGGGATHSTASPTIPESFTFAYVDPLHQRLLSATVQSDEDPVYCTVSEMTMVNAMSLRGNSSTPLLNVSTSLLKPGGVAGGGPHPISDTPFVPPTAAGRRGQSPGLLLDAPNAPATLKTSREVVAVAAAAAAQFGDAALEDDTDLESATAPSYNTPGRCEKSVLSAAQRTSKGTVDGRTIAGVGRSSLPAPHLQLQHSSSATAATAAELQRHPGRAKEDEEEDKLMPGSPLLPRATRAEGAGAYRGRSVAPSILKSLGSRMICGHGTASVAAKSGAAANGGSESNEARASIRSSSSRRSTLSSLASGLSRISSIFKRRVSRPKHGSVEGETPRSFRPSSSVSQPTLQQEVNTSTFDAVAAAAQGLKRRNTIETADISTDRLNAGVQVGPQQQQPPSAAVPETAINSSSVLAPREITNSSDDTSATLRTYEGEDEERGSGAVHAVPVEGASSGAEEKWRRKKDDAECPVRRPPRHCRRRLKAHCGISSLLSARGAGDRRDRCSFDSSADDVGASSSPAPSASASCAKRSPPRRRGGERRRGRGQQNEVAGGILKSLQACTPPQAPPPEPQSSDGSAGGNGSPNHSSSRQGCDGNRRDLAAGSAHVSETKVHQKLYFHALRGDVESPRAFRRSCECARRHPLLHDSPGHLDRGAHDSSNWGSSMGRDDVVPQPPTPSAAVLTARRREIRAKSRFMSSVNHFTLSWRTRQVARGRQEQLLCRDTQARLAQLQNRDAERKSRSEASAIEAAVSTAASRTASWLRLPARAQRSAAKARQTGTAEFSQRQLTPSQLQQYEEALARDLTVLDGILQKRRRRKLWAEAAPLGRPSRPTQRRAITDAARAAGPLPSRVAAATAAVASTATRMRKSSGNSTRVTPRYSGPTAPACLSRPIDLGSGNAEAVKSAAVDRGGGDDEPAFGSRADDSGRGGSPALCGGRTAAVPRQQPPTAGISYAASTETSTMAQVQRPNAPNIDDNDSEASLHLSDLARRSGNAARIAISSLQQRYEQLLQDLATQTTSQSPAATKSNSGDTSSYDQVFMKGRSRGDRSGCWHPYLHQHLSREQDEERSNRRAESSPSKRRRSAPTLTCVADVMEAEVARCAAALRAEYYQSQKRQCHQQHQDPSKAIDRGLPPPVPRGAVAGTVSIAHVAASYMQSLRPSCAGCRPQLLDEYITLALLSMMHGDAGERGCAAAVDASEEMSNVGQGQPRRVSATTLVQRRIREDLYAAPRCSRRQRMLRKKGEQRSTYSNRSIASVSPAAPDSASSGTFLSPSQLSHPFTPSPAAIYGALQARLMRRESRTRREYVSKEQEARYALQRLYIVETILALHVMREAAERQEREAPAQRHEHQLPPQITLAGHQPFLIGHFALPSCSSRHEPVTPTLSTSRTIRVTATVPGNGGDDDKSGSAGPSDGWVPLWCTAVSSPAREDGMSMPCSASLSMANIPESPESSNGIGHCGPPSPIAEECPPAQRVPRGSYRPPQAAAMDASLSDGTRGGSITAVGSLRHFASVAATPSSSGKRGGQCSHSPLSKTRSAGDVNVEGGGGGTSVATVLESREQSAVSLVATVQRVATPSSSSNSCCRVPTSPALALASWAKEEVKQSLAADEEKDAGGGVDVGDAAAASSSPMPSFEVVTEEAEEDEKGIIVHTRKAIGVAYDGSSREPGASAQRATAARGEGNGSTSQGADVFASLLPMCSVTARSPDEEALETPKRAKAHAEELGTQNILPLSSLPAVSERPPPQSAVVMDAGGNVEQDTSRSSDVDVAESSSTSSSSSKLSSRVKGDGHRGGAPQPSDTGADGAENAYNPAVASGSSTATVPATEAQSSADKSTLPASPAVDGLVKPSSAPSQAVEARPLSIDRGEHIADSVPRSDVDWALSGAAGTVAGASNSGAVGCAPFAAKHTNSTPRRSPPPSSSTSSSTPSSLSLGAHVTNDVEAAASRALESEDMCVSRESGEERPQAGATTADSEGIVHGTQNTGDASAEMVEAMAHGFLQGPVTPANATNRTAIASAAVSELTSEYEGPVIAEDSLRQAPGGLSPRHEEQERVLTANTSTATSASHRQVRFSLPPEVVSRDDGHDDGVIDAVKQKREEGRDTLRVTAGLQSMPPRRLEDAAVGGNERAVSSTDVVAVELWEKLNALDALLLNHFPNYFIAGTEEDGLPGVVMRSHGRPPLVLPPSPQPPTSAPSLQTSRSLASVAEGRELTPSVAAQAAVAASSARGVYATPLGDHLTPPRLPPESLASQLRRKYGLPQSQQWSRASIKMTGSRKAFTSASLADTSNVMAATPMQTDYMGRASVKAPPLAAAAVSPTRHSLRDKLPKQSTSTSLADNPHRFTCEEAGLSASALSVEPLDEANEQQRRHDHPAELTLDFPATATPSKVALTLASPSASVSGKWPLSAPATERPSPQDGMNVAQPEMRRPEC